MRNHPMLADANPYRKLYLPTPWTASIGWFFINVFILETDLVSRALVRITRMNIVWHAGTLGSRE